MRQRLGAILYILAGVVAPSAAWAQASAGAPGMRPPEHQLDTAELPAAVPVAPPAAPPVAPQLSDAKAGPVPASAPAPVPVPKVPLAPQHFGRWLLDHLLTDLAVTGGWRASWADDARAGFLAQALGGELSLGLEFGDGYAVLGGARVLGGSSSTNESPQSRATYLEALGHLGFQLRVTGLLRLGVGASGGLLRRWVPGDAGTVQQDAALLGGYLRGAVDFYPRPNAAVFRAFTLFIRVDIAGPIYDPSDTLPHSNLGLTLGLGFRL